MYKKMFVLCAYRFLTSPCRPPCGCLRCWCCPSRNTRRSVSVWTRGPVLTSLSLLTVSTSTPTLPGSLTLVSVGGYCVIRSSRSYITIAACSSKHITRYKLTQKTTFYTSCCCCWWWGLCQCVRKAFQMHKPVKTQ